MLSLLSTFLGPAFDLVKGWLHGKVAAQQQAQQLQRTIAQAKIEAAAQAQHDSATLAQLQVKASGRGLKWLSFGIWSAPMIWAFIAPQDLAERMTEALAVLPQWYVVGYLSISGAIWGLSRVADRIGFKRKA